MAEGVKRILVAEDNLAMGNVIRYGLSRAGYDVTLARCGQAAWELLREHDFDLFVFDFQMPGMTGGELCERIRKEARFERTPVIFLTAKALELDRAHYMDELSVDAIISKPFSPLELTKTVESLLAAAAAEA